MWAYLARKDKAVIVSSQFLDDTTDYAKQFQDTAKLFGKGSKRDERKYYSFKLSCDPKDDVTPEQSHRFAEDVAKKFFPDNECVIATHNDTNTIHTHIIVNAVSFENGRKLHIDYSEYPKMKDMVNEMGIERGFSPLDFRKASKESVTTAEKEIILKGGISWKEELMEVIDLAVNSATSMLEFEQKLNRYGVKITRNTDRTIAYLHPKKEKAIRGEKLGANYQKGYILNEFGKSRNRLDGNGAVDTVERKEETGLREYATQGSIGEIERTVRGITETVNARTSAGRGEQEQRLRAVDEARRREAELLERERQAAIKREQLIGGKHSKNDKDFSR
ncbi:hypothetical protein FACS1894188_13220 [Clostridia bacterium]|nr:hypothetical protein FACS1894188_13220 [Clostridia bacterium]